MDPENKLEHLSDMLLPSDEERNNSRIAASLCHEIRNPLTTVKGISQMLKANLPVNEALLSVLVDDIAKIEGFIRDFESVFAGDRAKTHGLVDLALQMNGAIARFHERHRRIGVAFAYSDVQRYFIRGDADWIGILLDRVFANIGDVLGSAEEAQIEIRMRRYPNSVLIEYWLGGPDADEPPEYASVSSLLDFGYGSLIVQKILEAYKGCIKIVHDGGLIGKWVIRLPVTEEPERLREDA